jgi:hypothetical protein
MLHSQPENSAAIDAERRTSGAETDPPAQREPLAGILRLRVRGNDDDRYEWAKAHDMPPVPFILK